MPAGTGGEYQQLPGADQSPIVGGNYFITPSQYGLHNDSMRRSDWEKSFSDVAKIDPSRKYVPWRNLIIPILNGGTEYWTVNYIGPQSFIN